MDIVDFPFSFSRDFRVNATDEALVASSCQGDLLSFGQLYERYYRFAVGIARCHLSDGHLAEDAAQESFAEAFRSLAALKDRNRFAQWLGTICRRISSRMAMDRRTFESLDEVSQPTKNSGVSHLQSEVQEALNQLDEASRELVVLHYFSGMSYDEISSVLELSLASIHGRLQRIRRKLAKWLNPKDSIGVTK